MARRAGAKEEDFESILRDGLSSSRTYGVLKTKHRSGIELRFKPFAYRLNDSVIYIGGKIAAFPDMSHEKWQNIGEGSESASQILIGAWQKLPRDRVSSSRVGSHVGCYVAVGHGDKEILLPKLEKGHFVAHLLQAISTGLEVEIEATEDVHAFCAYRYNQDLQGGFFAEGKKLPPRIVGKRSEVLFGQSFLSNGHPEMQEFMTKYSLSDDTLPSDFEISGPSLDPDDEDDDDGGEAEHMKFEE
jgi:hypothetical protein